MNLTAKRIRNRLALLRAYLEASEPQGAIPTTAYIESTSACNLSCPMCAREIAGPEWIDRNMKFEEFSAALSSLDERCELILPFAGGEPLLHPDIVRMVGLCSSSGRHVEMATNATLLSGRLSQDLIRAGLDTLIISLDAATAESYAKLRCGADYERTCSNIMTFLRYKQKLRARTFVVIQMIALPENEGEEAALRKTWSNLRGVDAIRVKADEVHVKTIEKGNVPARQFVRHCYFPWVGPLMIRYDGGIYPCCHFWRDKPIAYVGEQSIAELWNGPFMKEFRQAHAQGQADQYFGCRECQAIFPHPALVSGSLLVPPFLTRRAISYVEALNRHMGSVLIKSQKTDQG